MKLQNFVTQYFRTKIKTVSLLSKKMAGNEAFKIFCTPFFGMKYKDTLIKNAERISYTFEGLKTTGFRWNKGGNKKILIAHGFRSALVNFTHFAEKLSEKGFEVYAFDAPAHGLSEGKRLTAIIYKDFITALNKNFGPFDGYLTHSFGGLAVSLNLSEMQNNQNINTVLIAPAANTKQLTEAFLKAMRITDNNVTQHFYNNIKRLSGKEIDWFSISQIVKNIKGKVLWVQDLGDKVTPPDDAKEIQSTKQGNISFLFTENLGHRRIYKDDEVVKAVVNFF